MTEKIISNLLHSRNLFRWSELKIGVPRCSKRLCHNLLDEATKVGGGNVVVFGHVVIR